MTGHFVVFGKGEGLFDCMFRLPDNSFFLVRIWVHTVSTLLHFRTLLVDKSTEDLPFVQRALYSLSGFLKEVCRGTSLN